MNKSIITLSIAVLFALCACNAPQKDPPFRIGYVASPHLAALFLAEKSPQWMPNYQLVNFPSSADVGYALIAGQVDAGFVEPSKALAIKGIREFSNIQVVGKFKYKYGGVLIARKGLTVNLRDLSGLKVGRSEPDCKLYNRFISDLKFNQAVTDRLNFVDLPFDDMIPAIEAGKIDVAITKSSYAIYAEQLGYTIPYSQYDITAGDACCPAVVAELEFLLISRKDKIATTTALHQLLVQAASESDESLRAATSAKIGVAKELLQALPIAGYEVADDKLLKLFIETQDADAGKS